MAFTVVLCGWRTTNHILLATATLTVCSGAESISVAFAASPREHLAPVRRRVVVERRLELFAWTNVGMQLTQVYHRQPATSVFFPISLHHSP